MPITQRTGDEAGFREAVRSAVVGLGEGEVEVLDVRIEVIRDSVDEPAWQVTLVLPRPRGDTWDLHALLPVEKQAEQITDALAYRHDVEVEGLTEVWPTPDHFRPEDLPPDYDEPAPEWDVDPDADGHGPGR